MNHCSDRKEIVWTTYGANQNDCYVIAFNTFCLWKQTRYLADFQYLPSSYQFSSTLCNCTQSSALIFKSVNFLNSFRMWLCELSTGTGYNWYPIEIGWCTTDAWDFSVSVCSSKLHMMIVVSHNCMPCVQCVCYVSVLIIIWWCYHGKCCRVRLVSLSAQKFIADILNDVMQLNKMKGSAQSARSNKAKDKKYSFCFYFSALTYWQA